MLEANPTLGFRDVQGILATSSQLVDPGDTFWTTNAAGFNHSTKYGFGLVDAAAAVAASKVWENWGEEKRIAVESETLNTAIPDYPNERIFEELVITESDVVAASGVKNFRMEAVEVSLDLSGHASRGDLKITITSPSGTKSVLAPSKRPESTLTEHWKLTSLQLYGESPVGTWMLEILDENQGVVR